MNNFKKWLEDNVNNKNIVRELSKVSEGFYVQNDSQTSNVTEDQAVHLYKKKDKKICAHFSIDNNKLIIINSKSPKKNLDSCAEILPILLDGIQVKSQISNAKGKEITSQNVSDLRRALEKVSNL